MLDLAFFRKRAAGEKISAIDNLTLRIPKGASVGIIGKNGSGKSTLLKLITGIYKPSTGSLQVTGRVAALIELGAGFHPDFTGRENLYLGGIMHGLSRADIDSRFDDIVHFAELEDVIDDPVRTYSSGMFMRLGFSLAVHTDPDLLLIDEVLAVGDASFVTKCKDTIAKLKREGKTLLLVSHDLDAVERWCDEVLWLKDGEVRDRGDPRRVIDHYRQFIERGEEEELERIHQEPVDTLEDGRVVDEAQFIKPERWGSREIEIEAVRLLDENGKEKFVFHPDDPVNVEIDYHVNENVEQAEFGIAITRSDGVLVHGTNTDIEKIKLPDLKREGTVKYTFKRIGLLDGSYSLDIAVHDAEGYPYDYHKGSRQFSVRYPVQQVGVYLPEHNWSIEVKR